MLASSSPHQLWLQQDFSGHLTASGAQQQHVSQASLFKARHSLPQALGIAKHGLHLRQMTPVARVLSLSAPTTCWQSSCKRALIEQEQ